MTEAEKQIGQQIANKVDAMPPEAQATFCIMADAFAAGVAAGQAIAELEQAAGQEVKDND